jgi:hypothetical protein
MARSAVTVATMAAYQTTASITKDAYDIANDHEIDVSSIEDNKLVLFIEASDTKAATIEVKAGDYADASIGDLTITTAATGTTCVSLETARFKDSDGKILIDITSAAGATGNIYAVEHA